MVILILMTILHLVVYETGHWLKLMLLLVMLAGVRMVLWNRMFSLNNIQTHHVYLLILACILVTGTWVGYVAIQAYRLGDFVRQVGAFQYQPFRSLNLLFHRGLGYVLEWYW